VAVEVFDGKTRHIWVVSLDTGVPTQVTFAAVVNTFPVWTPDSKSIIFNAIVDGTRIHRKPVDGSGEAEFLESMSCSTGSMS
jgi:Tol biopolymer transport system component